MPTSCSRAPPATTTSASRARHPVVGDHRRLDPGLDQEAQQAQGDVEHDLHVDPGVVRHAEPLGVHLGHVPPGPHLLVAVDGAEEGLELAVAPGRGADLGLGDRFFRAACAAVPSDLVSGPPRSPDTLSFAPQSPRTRMTGNHRDDCGAHSLIVGSAADGPGRRSPSASTAAPPGSPAPAREQRPGRRCRRRIPRCRSRTGTCRGRCRPRRPRSGRRRTRRRRSRRAFPGRRRREGWRRARGAGGEAWRGAPLRGGRP